MNWNTFLQTLQNDEGDSDWKIKFWFAADSHEAFPSESGQLGRGRNRRKILSVGKLGITDRLPSNMPYYKRDEKLRKYFGSRPRTSWPHNIEEKSLLHVAMVAKL